jgi:prepilin-type N-terminal cleavage/methylation domain-containing protein
VSARARIRRAVRDERGFTITELLVTMIVGLIVLFALFGLFEVALRANGRVGDRVDAAQRGRNALEQITQELRSQVCLGPQVPPIVSGTDTSITFYADVGGETFSPDKRVLTYVPAAGATPGYILEQVYQSTGGTLPNLTWSATPSRTRRIIEGVTTSAAPVFRYWGFNADGSGSMVQLTSNPLTSTDRTQVVRVDVSFVARPTRNPASTAQNSEFDDEVYVRTADPTNPTSGPVCLM